MAEPMTIEQIRDYWTQQAQTHGQAAAASWSDEPMIDLEVRQIVGELEDGQRVVDIGCANGYSTVQFAAQRDIDIRGLDYVPEMVDQAKQRVAALNGTLRGRVSFDVGDITALNEPDEAYDAAVVVRVVINLGTWELQQQGLRECVRVIRPGGKLILSEASIQGWQSLNVFRKEWGLEPIPMPSFNQYLDEQKVVEALEPTMALVEIRNFSSTYFVGTRVLKPLLDEALGGRVNVADPQMAWNRWFAQLPAAGDFGTQKLFIFRKRG